MYIVSFNNSEYEIGGYEDDGNSIDYCTESNVDGLIETVCKDDEDYPLVFKKEGHDEKDEDDLVGYFYGIDDDDEDCEDYPIAVMYKADVTIIK